jgi:surface adhesion protein
VVTGSPLVIQLSNTQSITIPVGASSASSTAFAVRADDAYAQGTQTVTTSISGTSGGNYESLTTTSTATTTVNDDSDPTTVTLSVSSPTVVEGGSVTYTATLSNAVTGTPLVINLSNGQSITIPVGASSGTSAGHVVRADDAYAQGSQAVSVGVTSTSGGTYEALTTTSTASTTVSDDTDTTTVSLSGATSVTEGGNAVYTLTLSSPAATAVTVTLTYGGTAANGTDYTAVTTVTIPAGASSANFTVPTTNDTLNEASETIAISIGGVSGGGFEAIAAHPSNNAVTTTINDNDPLPTIAINDVVVNEAAGTATFTVTLSAASGQQVTVGYGTSNGSATAGSDYTAASGTLTFSPGVTSQTITVNILDDGTYEGVENFNVNLSTPTNATISDNLGVGTIRDDGTGTGGTDNDTPTLAVSSPTVAEGGGYAVFTLSLSNAATSATTVSLATVAGTATAGTDYSTTLQVSTDGGANWTNATSATFAAGATSVLVRSAITNDTLDEPNESFSLTATTTAGATTNASATGNATITDDDPTPTLAINDVSVNEGAGTMTFTVTLSTASGQQVTVNYGTSNGSATAGSDYTAASGTLTFSPGVTSQTITVSILNDTTTESTETFNVNLSGATNATIADNLGVGSIVDNDARPVIDLDANNSNAGGVDYTATFTENGSPVSIADTDISITDVDSTALTGATITLTNAQAGDVLAAGTLPSGITASLVGNVITLSGSATLAAYQTAIRAITFSSTSETPSTADRIITVTVTDGSNASAAATTYMHVVAVNDAPVATGGSVTGTEDTALVLSWATFGVTDVDSATTSLGIKIATLPADGTLQTWNGSAWTNVSSGQTITKATIDSGFFRLVPDANESGSDAYAGTAVGNRQSDYARFNFTPTDGSADGAVATVRIDITPVTDTAALTHNASSQVTGTLSPMTSIGLTRDYYEDVPTLTSGASSSAPATGETGIETAVPTSSSTITNVGVSGTNVGDGGVQVAEDDAYRVQGLIYLEAGKSYTFSGYADDTSRLEIGGTTVMSGQWGGSGQASDGTFTATTFTPTATGYYSLEFMVYNTSGPGSYDLNLSVNGAAAVDVSTANFYLYQSITQVDTAGAQRGAFVANTTTGEGGYYPVRYDSGVQSKVYLAPIVATLTDTDGSETLAVQLQNIPVGTIISDGTRSFTATASATSVVVTAWDLSRLSVTAPSGFSGTVTLTAVATATETATGTSTVTSLNIPITIDLNGALAQQAEANTYNADALIGLAGADIFNVSESGNGLSVAVTQGASGSIQALTGTETTATTNQVFSTGGGNDLVQSGAGDDTIYLGDSGNSNHPTTGAAPTAADIAATRLMTLADSSVVGSNGQLTSTADNTSSSSNTAINTWADVANAGSGNDVVYGQNGTDLIYGGSGNDYLNGGAGNDGLRGGAGNDILVGGAGNDVLRGDAGADVFRWEFGDKGTAGTPAADIIMDFDTATPGNGGDVLDLRDLLQGETSGNLSNYLHFSVSGGNTTIQISSSGAFSTGFATNKIDQTITLQNVDLTSSGALTTDQQIIQDLVNKSKLLVDGS